tara:strand:+ start:418 stop:1353 length:936 start_codon:yes stop_codon:yes gene_type:complete
LPTDNLVARDIFNLPTHILKQGPESGARLAIRLIQDAALRGELDPWDVDVIPVIDGFLDQLRQRIECVGESISHKKIASVGGSYERDLAQTSEAFLAASVLVGLKAELLEAETFPPENIPEEDFESDFHEQGWLDSAFDLPRNPERHLSRRLAAPPPLKRPVTLGELIEQLETIAKELDSDEIQNRRRNRNRRFSDRQAINQVTSLAHREKLPETTAALGVFLNEWEQALHWIDFEDLVFKWKSVAAEDLDTDRVGVFWALLFLCSQGKIELQQEVSLYAPLMLKRILLPGGIAQLPFKNMNVPATSPAVA